MGIALAQPLVINNSWTSASPGSIAITGVTAGNDLIMQFGMIGSSMGAGASITDSAGQTWTKLIDTNQPTGYSTTYNAVWHLANALAGTHTLSVPYTGTTYGASDTTVTLGEWSGMNGIDVAATVVTGTNANATATSSAASVVGDLAYFVGITPLAGGGITPPSSPWVTPNNAAINNSDSILAYQIMPSTTAVTATWVQYSSFNFGVIVVLFKPAVIVPPTKPRVPISQSVVRASTWFKRESGLHIPERGFVTPRAA